MTLGRRAWSWDGEGTQSASVLGGTGQIVGEHAPSCSCWAQGLESAVRVLGTAVYRELDRSQMVSGRVGTCVDLQLDCFFLSVTT